MKIIGLNIEKYIGQEVNGHNCDFTYEDSEFERHIIYIIEDAQKYEIILSHSEGQCGSGWTTASFGEMKINKLERFPAMMFRSVNQNEVDIPLPIILAYGDFSDIRNDFFYVSIDGGDGYYPCGGYSVNMDMFISNGRGIREKKDIKRKVWIFKGDSGLGKTFLSDKTGLSKYETDSSSELPSVIKEDIIVIGNKYSFDIEDVKSRIFEVDKVDVINVDFS